MQQNDSFADGCSQPAAAEPSRSGAGVPHTRSTRVQWPVASGCILLAFLNALASSRVG